MWTVAGVSGHEERSTHQHEVLAACLRSSRTRPPHRAIKGERWGGMTEANVNHHHQQPTTRLMVYSMNDCGRCAMEVAVLLLLLTVPLTTASPLRPTHRSDADSHLPPADSVQAPGAARSKATQEERAHALRVVAFHSEDKHVDMDALKLSEGPSWRPRPRRTTSSGCQLGTCQFHNLANTLFNFSKTSGKEESKKASHPEGYGR